jgi:hypothetical protein
MKKQILTLTMCLALTATSALAAATDKVSKTTPIKPVSKVEVKATTTLEKPCDKPCDKPVLTAEQQARKQFEARMLKERELFHQALNLTPEQKKKAEAIDEQSRKEAEPLFNKAREEHMKLKDLKAKKATQEEIAKQELTVKAARKELKKHFKASRKKFEAILTKDQLAKLKILKEQRKTEMKKFKKEHGLTKHNKPGEFHGPDAAPPQFPLSGNDAPKGACPVKAPCSK